MNDVRHDGRYYKDDFYQQDRSVSRFKPCAGIAYKPARVIDASCHQYAKRRHSYLVESPANLDHECYKFFNRFCVRLQDRHEDDSDKDRTSDPYRGAYEVYPCDEAIG